MHPSRVRGVSIRIGCENQMPELQRLSVVGAAYGVDARPLGMVGLIGPRSMDYVHASRVVNLAADGLSYLAGELYGAQALGKAEAWLVLAVDDGAELVTGPADGLAADALLAAIASGEVGHAHCGRAAAVPGDALLLRPGTLHAIGAGTFVYEIEQPSDLTFRVSDWGRLPARRLHVAEALRAIRPERHAEPAGSGFRLDGGALTVPEFRLELPDLASPVERRPAGETCEVVTALRGTLRLEGVGWDETLARHETVVVPASVARYALSGGPDAIAAVGSLP